MTATPVVLDGTTPLSFADYDSITRDGAPVVPSDEALARVGRSRDLFERHLATGVVCYGVNTGLGALAKQDLSAEDIALLPRQILFGRASAIGAPFPGPVARGMLLLKLVQFLSGAAAVTPDLCRAIAERLNTGLAPWVPMEGHGMAGEIIPLTHAAQPLIGEGFVIGDLGERVPAADWLAARSLSPYEPQPKEGIALINGVAAASAWGRETVRRLEGVHALSNRVAACTIEAMAAPLEPYAPEVAHLRPDPGVAETAAMLCRFLSGSDVTRQTRQAPVSLRVTPQIHGVLHDALETLTAALLREFSAVGDNPAFLAGDADSPVFGRLLHCGNFHAAALTHAVEGAALAVAQVGLLSERRLHRLVDARTSGLGPQLALRPGLDAGLVTLHKAVLGFTARIRSLAVPPSLQHGESSFGQEDVMTMTLPALDRLAELARLVTVVLTYELYTAVVGLDQRGETAGDAVERIRGRVRAVVPPYRGDRSYGPEIEALLDVVTADPAFGV